MQKRLELIYAVLRQWTDLRVHQSKWILDIFPDAKTCIVLAFRIPRGYFRGIEEGTYFCNIKMLFGDKEIIS